MTSINSAHQDYMTTSAYQVYLTDSRCLSAPSVESAIASLNLAVGARVLDAGTGSGAALSLLARAVGTTGSVLAVDNDPTAVAHASDYVEQAGIADRVTVQLGDMVEVLADAATAPEKAFDAIWAQDAIFSVYVEEPADVIRQMAQILRPGGIVALLYSNFYSSTFLPGHSRLERCLHATTEMRTGIVTDGPRHKGRQLAWLQAAGLDNVSLTAYPRVCFPLDSDPTIRRYLEQAAWPPMRKNAVTYGAAVGLSTAEVDEIQRLLTPGDPYYVLDEPGYYLILPVTLATGRRPA